MPEMKLSTAMLERRASALLDARAATAKLGEYLAAGRIDLARIELRKIETAHGILGISMNAQGG